MVKPSVRFEVFKRDAFTCQYCGKKAPDVVLHADHIYPASKGGEDDMMNLVTSCRECNQGKSDKTLDDNTAIEKQRRQLDELSQRREQIDQMFEWKRSLLDQQDDHLVQLCDYIGRIAAGYKPNSTGQASVRRWLQKYSIADLLTAIDKAAGVYLKEADNGELDLDSWERFFSAIPRIAEAECRGGMPDWKLRAFYVRGILRRRIGERHTGTLIQFIENCVNNGADVEQIVRIAKHTHSWGGFTREVEALCKKES